MPNDFGNMISLHDCLAAIKDWMPLNFQQLNSDKTEVLVFGPYHIASQIHQCIGPLAPNVKSTAKNLSVIFYPHMKFEQQIV